MADLSEFQELGEIELLRARVRELEGRLHKRERDLESFVAAIYRGAKDAAVLLGKPPKVPKVPRDRRTKRAEVALLHLSDWQVGKKTESFDSDVVARRVHALADKVIHLTQVERADHPVSEIHVLFGGDIIEGVTVFPGQAYEIDLSLLAQVFAAVGAAERLLRILLANFDKVVCWQEEGNHGRIGKRGDVPRVDNVDLLVYGLLKERVGGVEWHPRQSFYSIVEIGNYRALLVHGDEIKGYGGQIPAFGITKRVNSWATGVVPEFTDCYMGHWHQPLVLPIAHGKGRTFVNPSLESGAVYASEFMGAAGIPGQRLNFVDPERGRITSERIVWLDHVC